MQFDCYEMSPQTPNPSTVRTRADFLVFISALAQQAQNDPNFENPQTSQMLEALAAWIEDSDFHATAADAPGALTWQDLARMFVAANFYE